MKRGWGVFKNLAIIGGYFAFCIAVLIALRKISGRGDVWQVPETMQWPEWVVMMLIFIPIVLSIIGTFTNLFIKKRNGNSEKT